MAISKKLRFEVFKRDLFCCQYCGKTPPAVCLEADHIIPVSKKGKDVIDNLITSCFDCNRGKSDILLTTLPDSTIQKHLILREREDQYKSYQKLLLSIDKRLNEDVDKINSVYRKYYPDYWLTDSFKVSIKRFLKKLGYQPVQDAMETACAKMRERDVLKYFCGICWNIIKKEEPKNV